MDHQTDTPDNAPYTGDLEKTRILSRLFEAPVSHRDEDWQQAFLENVADASFACGDPQVVHGPDGFPYFELNLPAPGVEFECFVIRHLVRDYLFEHGFGVVIHPSKGTPDWVFSYGDLVNFHFTGAFYADPAEVPLQEHGTIAQDEQVLVAQPSELILPQPVRRHLRRFLEFHALHDVRILLMQRKKGAILTEELVFNITRDMFPSQEQYEGLMRNIGWFLPRHFTYVSMAEGTLASSFSSL